MTINEMRRKNKLQIAIKREMKAKKAFVDVGLLWLILQGLDASKCYHIEVVSREDEACRSLKLIQRHRDDERIFASIKDEGTVIFGNVEFWYSCSKYDYGSCDCASDEHCDSDVCSEQVGSFDSDKPFAVVIHHERHERIENRIRHDAAWDTLVIYAPRAGR